MTPLFLKSSCFTDDNVLIAVVCEAILNDPADIGRLAVRKRAYCYAVKLKNICHANNFLIAGKPTHVFAVHRSTVDRAPNLKSSGVGIKVFPSECAGFTLLQ